MAAVKLKVVYAVAAVCASVIFWGFVAMMLLAAMRELAAGADVPPCAPVSFVFSEQAECTRLGLGPACHRGQQPLLHVDEQKARLAALKQHRRVPPP